MQGAEPALSSQGNDRGDGISEGRLLRAHPGLGWHEVRRSVGEGPASEDASLRLPTLAYLQSQIEPTRLLHGDGLRCRGEDAEAAGAGRHPEVEAGAGTDAGIVATKDSATARLSGMAPTRRTVPVTLPVIGLIWARAEATPWGKVTSVWKPDTTKWQPGAGLAGEIAALALTCRTIGVSTGSGQ